MPLAGLVDTALLGHLPEIRFLAGVALGTLVFDFLYWTFGFLRMGTTGLTAQAWGRQDGEEVERLLREGLGVALGIAAALLLLQWPLRELAFRLLSGAPEVEAAGRAYFDARIWGAPATLANLVCLGWLLGREESREALWVTAAGSLGNILLSYLLIFRWGFGAWGAGLGTALSQYLMLAIFLLLYRSRHHPLTAGTPLLRRGRLLGSLKLYGDLLIRTLCLLFAFGLFTNGSALFGTAVLAANSLLLRLLTFGAYLIDGAAFATESLAGNFFGRGDRSALGRLLRLAMVTGLACAALILTVFWTAPRPLLGLLTSHRDIVDLAVASAPWLIPLMLLGSLAYILDGFFIGLTRGRTLRNASFWSAVLGFLPVAALAMAVGSLHLLWLALTLFMAARAASLGWASRRLLRPAEGPS